MMNHFLYHGLISKEYQGSQGYESPHPESEVERSLWMAVILQGLQDATSLSAKPKMKLIRHKAIAWFSLRNTDFIEVCTLADLQPERVLTIARRAIQQTKEGRGIFPPAFFNSAAFSNLLCSGRRRRRMVARKPIPVPEFKRTKQCESA